MTTGELTNLLDTEIAALAQKLDATRAAIREAKREYRRIEIELGALRRVQNRAAGFGEIELPRPSAAVLDYLRQHPGARQVTVVGALVNGIRTTSAEPEKLLANTVRQLERAGRIKKSPEGNLFLGEESPVAIVSQPQTAVPDLGENKASGQPQDIG